MLYYLGIWSVIYDSHIVIKDVDDNRHGGRLTFIAVSSGFTARAADLACQELRYGHVQEYGTVKNLG